MDSPIYAVDLEMIQLIDGSTTMARAVVVDEQCSVVLNLTVRPTENTCEKLCSLDHRTPVDRPETWHAFGICPGDTEKAT